MLARRHCSPGRCPRLSPGTPRGPADGCGWRSAWSCCCSSARCRCWIDCSRYRCVSTQSRTLAGSSARSASWRRWRPVRAASSRHRCCWQRRPRSPSPQAATWTRRRYSPMRPQWRRSRPCAASSAGAPTARWSMRARPNQAAPDCWTSAASRPSCTASTPRPRCARSEPCSPCSASHGCSSRWARSRASCIGFPAAKRSTSTPRRWR